MVLQWTVVFLALAIIAAIFGFWVAASAFTAIAKVLFFVFVVLFVISLIYRTTRRV